MDFLDDIFFENTLRAYIVVAGVILLSILIKRYLSRYIASLLYIPVRKSSSNIEKNVFINLVVSPLEIFLVILISILALDRLTFPHALDVQVYHVTTKQIIESVFLALLIISFINLLVRFIDFIALVISNKQHDLSQSENQLIFFFKDFLKVILVIGGLLLVLKFCFGTHIGHLITGLSIVGAALALAAKESLENLIASFIIFFDKPFTVGHLVRINNYLGYIEKIGLRSTRLRTIENSLVVVPNKQMVDSILDNWSMRREIRTEIKIELVTQTSAVKIQLALDGIKNLLSANAKIISYTVFLTEISKNAALIMVEYFTSSEYQLQEQNQIKQEVNLEIKSTMEKNGILLAVSNLFTFSNSYSEGENK